MRASQRDPTYYFQQKLWITCVQPQESLYNMPVSRGLRPVCTFRRHEQTHLKYNELCNSLILNPSRMLEKQVGLQRVVFTVDNWQA